MSCLQAPKIHIWESPLPQTKLKYLAKGALQLSGIDEVKA